MAYIISSGITSDGIILKNDSMTILDGGVANRTKLSSRGFMFISHGGLANSTTANSSSFLYVSVGGTANSTMVNSSGSMTVSRGGTANGVTVGAGGKLYVYTGGTATEIKETGGYVSVESGANVTFVRNSMSWLTIRARESATIHSGTTATEVSVEPYGYFFVFSGGTALGIVEKGGYVSVESGAEATFSKNTISGLELTASATVHSGTTAVGTMVKDGGNLYVFSSGIANQTTLTGTSTGIWSEGGNSGTLYASCGLFVSGGLADETIIKQGGSAHILSSGVADHTTVNFSGFMFVSSGGTANGTTVNSGLLILDGGYASDVLLLGRPGWDSADVIVENGGIAEYVTIEQYGDCLVSSGGTANHASVNSDGSLTIGPGGTANGAAVNSGGSMTVGTGGTANETTLNLSGRMIVEGIANGVTVNSGSLAVSSGATATNIVWTPCEGRIDASDGAVVTFVSEYSGVYYGSDDRLLSHAKTMSDITLDDKTTDLYVMSGGVCDNVVLQGRVWTIPAGLLVVGAGGQVNNADIYSGGTAVISSCGVANGMTVNARAALIIASGATATATTVNVGGSITVSSGVTATGIVENGGFVKVEDGATVSFVSQVVSDWIISGNTATIHSGTTALNTYDNGEVHISSGALAENTSIFGGSLILHSGGRANNTQATSSGGFRVLVSGGTASGITGTSGSVTVCDGGIAYDVTGRITLVASDGGILSGATLLNYALLSVAEGGYAENVLASGVKASASVSSGGLLSSTTVFESAFLVVRNGGSAVGGTIKDGGILSVREGGTAEGLAVESGGSIVLSSGGTAINLDIASGAHLSFSVDPVQSDKSGTLFRAQSGGSAFELKDGVLSGFTLERGHLIDIRSGGKAIDFRENGGVVHVEDGAVVSFTANAFSGAVIGDNESATVHSGTTAVSAVLTGGHDLILNQDGSILQTSADGGTMQVFSGGIVDGAIVNGSGHLDVLSGGTAVNIAAAAPEHLSVTIAKETYVQGVIGGSAAFEFKDGYVSGLLLSGMKLTVASGATAEAITMNNADRLIISSGGVAKDILEDGGYVYVSRGGSATFVSNTISGRVLTSCNPTLHSGTTAVDVTLGESASLAVFDGGRAYDTVLAGGKFGMAFMNINAGGTASGTTLNSMSVLYVNSGGSASRTVVNDGARLAVTGGTAGTVVQSGGSVTIGGGTLKSLNLRGGNCTVYGGTAQNVTVNTGAAVYVHSGLVDNVAVYTEVHVSGGTVKGAKVYNNALVRVYSSGAVTNTTVISGGQVQIYRGGTMCSATVSSGGSLAVGWGGKLTGEMTFRDGAKVTAEEGAIIDFDLSLAGKTALINNLSAIQPWNWAPTLSAVFTLTVDADRKPGSYVYALAEGAQNFASTITVVDKTSGDELGVLTVGETVRIGGNDYTLSLNEGALSVTVDVYDWTITGLVGTADKVSWTPNGAPLYSVELSMDDYGHALGVFTNNLGVDLLDLPSGSYQWRVTTPYGPWALGEEFESENEPGAAKVVQSNNDGIGDLFFATPNGTWDITYYAQNVGSINDWEGTKGIVSAKGRNRIRNLYFGSSDANILCLTDDANGDAIFVDDIYTELPDEIEEHTARLYRIQEIRAGAGNDIVDMTSQRFEYTGDGILVRGGDGNDTIWANKGCNYLFGDDGNDRIAGASLGDTIVGGSGNDQMHGGGGDDVFTFCENWGNDTIRQLETGSVTLWFASGDETHWDAANLTYADGDNSVIISGVSADRIELKFGDDGSEQYARLVDMGAFDAFTSHNIFEAIATLA